MFKGQDRHSNFPPDSRENSISGGGGATNSFLFFSESRQYTGGTNIEDERSGAAAFEMQVCIRRKQTKVWGNQCQ